MNKGKRNVKTFFEKFIQSLYESCESFLKLLVPKMKSPFFCLEAPTGDGVSSSLIV